MVNQQIKGSERCWNGVICYSAGFSGDSIVAKAGSTFISKESNNEIFGEFFCDIFLVSMWTNKRERRCSSLYFFFVSSDMYTRYITISNRSWNLENDVTRVVLWHLKKKNHIIFPHQNCESNMVLGTKTECYLSGAGI